MIGLLKSVVKLAEDVTSIALAPVEIAVDTVRVATKPVKEMAEEVVKTIKQETK